MTRAKHGFLHDEQGDRSFARLALSWVLVFTAVLISVVVILQRPVPDAVWGLLGTIMIGLMAWAGGRAVARYLGPQLAGIMQGRRGEAPPPEPEDDEEEEAEPAGFRPHQWKSGDPHEGLI